MAKVKRFKEEIDRLLARSISKDALPDAVKKRVKGTKITYLEAIILAQIYKAMGGDTSAITFLRDSSGNKLKECVEQRVSLKFEDL